MFQNLAENLTDRIKKIKVNIENKAENIESKNRLLLINNIVIYIIAFLISMISIKGLVNPFALAIFVACCNSNVPAGIVLIVTIIGNFIGFGFDSTLSYILNVLVFIFSILIFKPIIQDNRNEMTKLGKNLLISTIFVQAIKCIFKSDLLVYDILISISSVVLTYVFYKIFINSLIVVKEFNKDKAFSIEEVIGATILVAISASALDSISIFGVSITNVICIFMILALSLRSGVLVGATTGISIGLILGILGIATPIQILAYSISGFFAGLLSRFGKIATVIGFLAGNIIIEYISTGFLVELIPIIEIIIAGIFSMFVPRFVGINIQEISDDVKLLEWQDGVRLSDATDTQNRLNSISGVVEEMAKALGIKDKTLIENEIDNINNSKVMFVEDLLNNIERFPNNILYDDLMNLESGIIEDIYIVMIEKSEMTKEDLMKIFEKRKNYIVGSEDNDVIKEDINQIIRIINRTYRINEMSFNWKTRFEEHRKTMSKQLKGVSKAINEIADEITKEKEEKSKYKDKEKQIRDLLFQKGIEIKDLKIKKASSGKLFVDIYYENITIVKEKDKIKCIENIISKVCDEKVLLQKDTSNIDASSYMQRYTSEDKYTMQLGYAKTTKSGNNISGDSSIQIKLEDDKCLIVLSDGMGSGIEARKSSQIVIKMMKKLLTAGFDKDDSVELINSTIKLTTEEVYATIDTSIFDLYNGTVEFIKNGACKTYIKNRQNIDVVESNSLPLGILNNVEVSVYDKDISDGDIFVMCTDGVIDSKEEEQGDKWFIKILKNISTNNVQKMADILLNEAIDNNYGICKDDMSVIVVKISKKNKK